MYPLHTAYVTDIILYLSYLYFLVVPMNIGYGSQTTTTTTPPPTTEPNPYGSQSTTKKTTTPTPTTQPNPYNPYGNMMPAYDENEDENEWKMLGKRHKLFRKNPV